MMFCVCSAGSRTSRYKDKKPCLSNDNENQRLSLFLGGENIFVDLRVHFRFWHGSPSCPLRPAVLIDTDELERRLLLLPRSLKPGRRYSSSMARVASGRHRWLLTLLTLQGRCSSRHDGDMVGDRADHGPGLGDGIA